MLDWILSQNCRNTLPLHTVEIFYNCSGDEIVPPEISSKVISYKAFFISNGVPSGMMMLRRNKHDKRAHASETMTQGTDILDVEARELGC